MKTRNILHIFRILVLGLSAAIAGSVRADAQSGTWTNQASGSWSDPLNWLGGVVATGSGSTALFNTIDVLTNATPITVTADYSDAVNGYGITNANIFFGDTVTNDGVGSWILAEGGLGITLDSTTSSNSIIDVNLAKGAANNLIVGWGTATITANLAGTNTLIKTGPNRLILNPTSGNTYSGGTVISNGMVELGAGKNGVALNSGPVTFYGGALRLSRAAIPGSSPNSSTSDGGYPYSVIVPDGQSGTIYMTPYATGTRTFGSGTVSGGGTLNLIVDYVRDNLAGDWTGFTGRLNVASSTRGNSDLRIDSTFVVSGWSNNAVSFTTNGINGNIVTMYNPGAPIGSVIEIGEMSASVPGIVNVISASTTLNNGGGNSAPFVLQVGALNTDAAFSGNFTAGNGSVGIIKVGTGTWTLNGLIVEYTGKTVVEAGTLQIGSGTSGKLGRSAVVTNNATLAFGRTDTALVVTNVIDGPGILLQRGSGRTTLAPASGANTYTGQTVITNGTLAAASQSVFGALPGSFVADQILLNGGAFAATTTLSLNSGNRGITVGANGGGLGADGTGTLTVADIISGAGSLGVVNTGTVELTGANALTGKTILQSGTLLLNSEAPLGVAPGAPSADQITFDGGTLHSASTYAIDDANRGITFNAAGGTLSPDAATTLTLSESVSGSGSLIKSGAGTVVLNGASSHTGSTLINQGTLALGAGGSSVSPTIFVNGGASFDVTAKGVGGYVLSSGQTLSGNGTVIGNVSVTTGSTLSPGTSVGILTINGDLALSGGTNLIEISSSTNDLINVTGNLALSGVTTINLSMLSSLPVGTYPLIKYSGSLTAGNAANLTVAGYPPSRLAATLVHNAGTKSIDLVIAGSAGSLVWQGGLNANAWDVINTANWLNGGSPDVFYNGDAVTFDNTGAANPNVNLTVSVAPSTATVNSTTDYTFSGIGKLTGLASLNKAGANKLTILTTNDNSAGTTISGGTVQVGNGTTSGALGTGPITDNAALVYNLPDTQVVGNQITGTGSLTVQAGTVTLTENNSYGASTISSGSTLQVGNGGNTGSVGTGGVSDNGALVYNRTGTVTNSGAISGAGSLTVQGSGTVALSANNSYVGPTTVDTGTLQVGAGGISGTLGTAGSVTLTNGGTLAFNRSDVITNMVAVLGTNGTLAQAGAGTLIITNDNNAYGPTLISAGKLQLSDGVNASGTLGLGTITVNSPGALIVNRPDAYTMSNTIAGSGSVTYLNSPTNFITTPSGDNTYSGGTTLSNSTVVLVAPVTNPNSLGAQSVNQTGFGSGTLTVLGNSRVQMAWADQSDPNLSGAGNFANAINVPAGQTLSIDVPGRFEFSSTVSGSGTINYGANYVRGNVSALWTNFTGVLNVVSNSVNTNTAAHDFRIFNTAGFPKAKVHLDAAGLFNRGTSGASIPIGEFSGTDTAFFGGTGGSEGGNAVSWVIGGLNTDSTYAGTSSSSVAVGITKVGTGRLTFTGANNYTGDTVVSNGVLALTTDSLGTDATLSSSANIIVAAPGVLDVSGHTDGTLQLGTTLAGNGTVLGGVYNAGTIAPGFSTNGFGNLTITSNLVSDGAVNLDIDHIGSAVSDKITAPSIVINGSINVTQLGTNNLETGDTFVLFSGPVSGAGTNSLSLPAANVEATITYVWTNKLAINGTVQLLQGAAPSVNMNPTNITFSVSSGSLNLSWPADHLGWRLQSQTNTLAVGLNTNWADVAGSTTVTQMSMSISPTNGAVFFRLVNP